MASKRLSVIFDAVDNLSAKLSHIADTGNEITSCFQNVENSANAAFSSIENSSQSVTSTMEQASSAANDLSGAADGYGNSVATAAQASKDFAGAGNAAEEALGEIADTASEAEEEIENFGDNADEAGNMASDAIGELRDTLVSAGIVELVKNIASAFLDCAGQAEQVETSIAKLQTIAGGGSIPQLTSEINELSSETGQAAEALADTAYDAISAGTAVEDSVEMAATASELATAGFTDTSSALSVLETALNSYGDAAGSAEHVSDSLVTVQNLGVTTVAQLASQMGKAISTASAYNISLENLESGYISVTKAGINTAEGTTYLSSMFNELGNSSSDVSKILQQETGKTFGQLMNDGYSLADVLEILFENCNEDSEAMMNLWGSAEAGKAASAIIGQGLDQFNANLETLQTNVGTTADAYEIMANTTEYAHNKMQNAATNFQNTIGANLNPALTKLYNLGASIFIGMNKVVTKYPAVEHVIVALTAGLGTAAVGIAGYTLATKAASAAQAVFAAVTATETAALAAQIAIVAGAVVAVGVLAGLLLSTSDGMEELTYSSQKQKEELDSLNSKYEETCNATDKTSSEALVLKAEIDDMTASFEESSMTLEKFYSHVNDLCDAHDDIVSSYSETNTQINQQAAYTGDLIGKLNELRSSTDNSIASQEQMQSVVGKLAEMYPELGIDIDAVNGNLDDMVDKINAVADAQNAQTKYENASNTYADLIKEQSQLEEAKKEAWDNYVMACEKFDDANGLQQAWGAVTGTGIAAAMDDAEAAYNRASKALEENLELQKECTDTMSDYRETVEGLSEETVTALDATSIAISGAEEEIAALATAYGEVYDSALKSMEGQYDLWDKVKEVSVTSVSDMTANLDSQLQYWQSYGDNLESLSKRSVEGLQELVNSMDDGSEESASALAGMANASDEELEKMVKKYSKVQSAQQDTATKVADMATEFSTSMDDINNSMQDAVDKMNMENDAAAAAQKTIQAYINNIKSMVPGAEDAASQVASAATKALNSKKLSQSVPGHAKGTIDSENMYIAGEEGPELILSGGGDEVFPASETNKILSAVSDNTDDSRIIESVAQVGGMKSSNAESSGAEDRTVTIRLEGAGSVNIAQNTDKESLWDGIKGNFKQIFMSVLEEEIYEEGAGAYEF